MDSGVAEVRRPLGVRDRNKLDRRRRIREAARNVFCARGYLDATTREICERAGVGNGTLFRHAADKRELLLLVVNDDLDHLHADVARSIRSETKRRSLREKVLKFYSVRYEYFAKYPQISRPYVKEAFNFMGVRPEDVGPEARRHRARRIELVSELRTIVANDLAHCKDTDAQAQLIADLIHAIYLSASRQWLEANELDAVKGVNQFARLLDLAARGFTAQWSDRK